MDIFVDSRAGNDENDGRSAATAFKTVGHALQAAKAGNTVVIAPGAYDQDLPQLISALRAAKVSVTVAGAH